MKRGLVWFLGILSFICFISSGYFLIEHYKYPELLKGLTPFHSVLEDQGNHSFQGRFKAVYSELHYVEITYPNITADPEVNKILKRWRAVGISNEDQLPGPDLHWQILFKNKVIGKGGGETGWVGDGRAYGEFEVKSGRIYEIHIFFGPKFEPFLKYSPKIEIGVARVAVSLELEWSKELNIPISIALGIIGIVFLIFTLACYCRLAKMKLKEITKIK